MKKLLIPIILLILCSIPTTTRSQMFSLWGNEGMTEWCIETREDTATFFSVYIFLEPGVDGAFAAEYKVPSLDDEFTNYFCIGREKNYFVSDAMIGNPYGSPGIIVDFMTCQTDLVWIYRLDMLVLSIKEKRFITLEPHDDSGFMGITTCVYPRPLEDAMLINWFRINNCCLCGSWQPWLISAEAVLRDKVAGYFDSSIYLGWQDPPVEYPFDSRFMVCSTEGPPDTIGVIEGKWLDANVQHYADSCLLKLERSMQGGVQYKLVANVCGGDMGNTCCAVTEQEFVCPVITTHLQEFNASPSPSAVTLEWRLSSMDPGTVFIVSRRGASGPLTTVGEIAGEEGELSYRFEDRPVSGGKMYIYRVEYVSDADQGVLFETDAIEVTPIPVTLAQNHPNPFNPSTTIEFYIPEARQVSLRVFDIRGRLVRTLVDSTKEPGSHSVSWDGLDDSGNAVQSGVYFSRLSTGKTIFSRKMILLK